MQGLVRNPLSYRCKAGQARAPAAPLRSRTCSTARRDVVVKGGEGAPAAEMTGLVFGELRGGDLYKIDPIVDKEDTSVSIARVNYEERLEAAINEQVNTEYNLSYIYEGMANYFYRDNIGLLGFAAYFRHNSDDERHHARMLMQQQAVRGGRVKLGPLSSPQTEFSHSTKDDALYAVELALTLEKLNFTKLRALHDVAVEANDAEMCQFIEDKLLHEQARDIKQAADLVSQVRRAGPGHGTFHVDVLLQNKYGSGGGDGFGSNGAALG